MIKLIQILILALLFFSPQELTFSRENITDGYIKDFKTEITLNPDSSVDIVEKNHT